MTQIMVLGHGGFATALLDTARMITGATGEAVAIEFPVGSAVDELAAQVSAALDAAPPDGSEREPVLVLADVAGGSPARVALGEALAGRAEVVTGANLPMLIEALAGARSTAPAALAARVVASARAGVRDLGSEAREKGRST